MPYQDVSELPKEVRDKYDTTEQRAFMAAFNRAMEKDEDESRAFAIAHSAAQSAGKKEIDLKPTETMANNARRALERRAELPDSKKGMTATGVARARQLSNRENLSPETVRTMNAWFARHESTSRNSPNYEDREAAWVAWNGWGGDAGKTWAAAKVKQLERDGDGEKIFGARTGFKMMADNRWIAWYATSFGPDKDDEYFSTAALIEDVKRMNQSGKFPELWFRHIPGTRHGHALTVQMINRFAVAVGEFDDTPMASKIKAYYERHPEACEGVSFGYKYNSAQKRGNIYYDVRAFEISPLPAEIASNPFVRFEMGDKAMNRAAIKALAAALGDGENPDDEAAEQIINEAYKQAEYLEAAGIGYKGNDTDNQDDQDDIGDNQMTDTQQTERPTEASEFDPAAMQQIVAAIKAATTDSMATKMDEMRDELKKYIDKKMMELREPKKKAEMPEKDEDDAEDKKQTTTHPDERRDDTRLLAMFKQFLNQGGSPDEQQTGTKSVSIAELTPEQVIALGTLGNDHEKFKETYGIHIVG